MDIISRMAELGQSFWYDNFQRSILMDGSLEKLIQEGKIKGLTSNPSIFQKAISSSKDYDLDLKPLAWSGLDAESIFWSLAVEDIRKTADLLRPVYERSGRKDGFVSLEVSPLCAHDTQKTIAEAKRLWILVDRPNLMIKIPATIDGIPAIRASIASGININITLIFSLKRYSEVIDAYIKGLEERIESGKEIDSISSVASFFVSRVDTKADGYLGDLLTKGSISQEVFDNLSGKAAIANARLAYQEFERVFKGSKFLELKEKGAQVQRPLWASTSTKNPKYRDVIYVEELIGKETVNTLPPVTLDAFFDHGVAEITIYKDLKQAEEVINDLGEIGISMDQVTLELENEGVKAFSDSFSALLSSVDQRRKTALEELNHLAPEVEKQVNRLESIDFVSRLYQKDASLWTADASGQAEIRQRMNWLTAPWDSRELILQLKNILPDCRKRGFTHVILLGMGGSSLAPEVLRKINGIGNFLGEDGLDLSILDSTDPDQVLFTSEIAPAEKCLYIVASKSGSTGEINAFFDFFWNICTEKFGDKAGEHFIAITDPQTKLEKTAREKGFWKIFNADPQVGGRNSALTAFGIVPAALIGMDVEKLLEKAALLAADCKPDKQIQSNPSVVLGIVIGTAAKAGLDKLTILTDQEWAPFGSWLEQLVAESSGKIGKGIVPVANEPVIDAKLYKKDRIFIYMRNSGQQDAFCNDLRTAGHPVICIDVNDPYDLGGQFYLWEVAIATACSVIGVNSFDQPDVQDAKTRTIRSLEEYKRVGKFEDFKPSAVFPDATLYSKMEIKVKRSDSLAKEVNNFLANNLKETDYIAINAFLPRNSENEETLEQLRADLVKKYKVATMLGFGPRFLHSTGQLHKGGPNSGVFLMITAQRPTDIEIPGQGVTFGVMQRAQAIGDLHALEAKGRRVLWIDLAAPDPSLLISD